MEHFGQFYLDKEKDIIVELERNGEELFYTLRTPNHNTGNLITNLARLCELPLDFDERGLKVIRGRVPCYVDGSNRKLYIFRMGNTKIANIFPDGGVELKASIPAISKALMSQTKEYRLPVSKTIVKTYIFDDCKFRTDFHTHMNANLEPDILIALGIRHQIRYPLYYIKKLNLRCTPAQVAALERSREAVAEGIKGTSLTGKYLNRKIDDNTFINFADLMLRNPEDAAYNISKIRVSLAVPKDGQAVFADLEKVYLYRYVFTKGVPADHSIPLEGPVRLPDADITAALEQMFRDKEDPRYRHNTLFQDKLLWIARSYRRYGIDYVEISDSNLVKEKQAGEVLRQIHAVMPAITRETGVMLRFLAAIRRIPLTIVRDSVTPNDYLAENLRTLRAAAADPYVAGSDIIGEEINDIRELKSVIREIVSIAKDDPSFVIRIHAGENDSLRDNVHNSILCVRESLSPGQPMPVLRIGHGLYTSNLHSPRGQRLIRDLLESRAALEFQLTSNVRLNNLSSLERHPLKAYLREGIRCVQGTDGGALYGTNSIDEELSLEKLIGLSHEELLQMKRTEEELRAASRAAFERKSRIFASTLQGRAVEEAFAERLQQTRRVDSVLWRGGDKLDTAQALSSRIRPLPEGKTPLIVAGGSFNNDRHITRVREDVKRFIDSLLNRADPSRVFFVIGHRLMGYERYLLERSRGRFEIFAFVPSAVSAQEKARLERSGVSVRVSIESSGNGLYKSVSYEIFKRRPSVLLAFDGNSPAANLVQEAKNGAFKCAIYLDGRSRPLRAKAATLHGYVQIFDGKEDLARLLLKEHNLGVP